MNTDLSIEQSPKGNLFIAGFRSLGPRGEGQEAGVVGGTQKY